MRAAVAGWCVLLVVAAGAAPAAASQTPWPTVVAPLETDDPADMLAMDPTDASVVEPVDAESGAISPIEAALAVRLPTAPTLPPGPAASPSPTAASAPAPAPTAVKPSPAGSPRATALPSPSGSPAPATSAAPVASPAPGRPAPRTFATPTPVVIPTPSPAASAPPSAPFHASGFAIKTLPVGKRPYDSSAVTSLRYEAPYHDRTGVPMALVGGHLVYKPAGLAQLAISYLNGYRVTRDWAYLGRAQAIARVFVRIGVVVDGGLYLPYTFNFAMHKNAADVIRAPWYSAMAQGLALSVFTRLYQLTGREAYRDTAAELFASLRHLGRSGWPWVSYVDSSGYLWLEEYDQPQPEHTLNGFNFALFGIYDWFTTTGDPVAKQELQGALTTLKAYVARYRNPGGPIDYCLKHGKPQLKYHHVVIGQLQMMTSITGDPYFATEAALFAKDA